MSPPAPKQKLPKETADKQRCASGTSKEKKVPVKVLETSDRSSGQSQTSIKSMEKFTPEEVEQAKQFGEFIIDLLENHKESLIFYLSDNAVLDWFGHTVKSPRNIGSYLKTTTGTYSHQLKPASPVRSIGFRETHVIKFTPEQTKPEKRQGQEKATKVISETGEACTEVTPPQLKFSPPNRNHVHMEERGQGDGPHNCGTLESPMKKCRLDLGEGDAARTPPQLKYISAEGAIEFRKKSQKKFQSENKWHRPCKLEVAYSATNFQDCTIYMIIYQGNMKCRRNLLKDFEQCEPDN